MAIVDPTPLTSAQQYVLDRATRRILECWPDIRYGEFDVLDGQYVLELRQIDKGSVRSEFATMRRLTADADSGEEFIADMGAPAYDDDQEWHDS